MKKLLYPIIFILLLEIASAAILHGTIYDSRLNKLNDVIVEINSTPSQIFVSKEGQYSFVLDPGAYTITAKYKISDSKYLYTSADVTMARDGYFVVDLFLNPAKKVEMPTTTYLVNYSVLIAAIIIVLLALLGYTFYKLRSKSAAKPEFDNPLNELLKIIKQEGGRATQKNIRKKIPLSEAKISLMISELENKGILKKIKKGRGNIIIFNKESK